MKNILTIAGSDSGGGAGIQADLKTITMLGQYGGSVLTSVTAQNTLGVQEAFALPPAIVAAQLDSVLGDIHFAAAKTGMLANAGLIETVCEKIEVYQLTNLVVDPVMVATSGDVLLEDAALDKLIGRLLPLAFLVTPNMNEAAILSGVTVETLDDMQKAAQIIKTLGPRYVLVKGGHLPEKAVDVLYDGQAFTFFSAEKIETNNTHGTGCTLSAAIASFLGRGLSAEAAIERAKAYLTRAIAESNHLSVGHGNGPLCHNYALLEKE